MIRWSLIILYLAISSLQPLWAQMQSQALTAYNTDSLEIAHRSAIHIDSTQAVFHDQEAWINAYKQLVNDLSKQLKSGGVILEKPLRCKVRIFFGAEGNIVLFGHQMAPNALSPEQEARFQTIVHEFSRQYRVPITAPEPFKQCGAIMFQANVD